MAAQIEDDVFPRTRSRHDVKVGDWQQEHSTTGKKLDLVPSYEEILDCVSSSSQPSLSSQRNPTPYSPSVISQSQPVRTRRVRLPYFNTQKTTTVIDLEELDELVESKHLQLSPSGEKSSSKTGKRANG